MNAHDLTGKTAFVSGAFGGLGLHFARVLAGHGARVALAGRRIELGRTVAAEIGAAVARPGDVRAYRLDVTDAEIIDASGKIVMPGLVDTHRHVKNSLEISHERSPYKGLRLWVDRVLA